MQSRKRKVIEQEDQVLSLSGNQDVNAISANTIPTKNTVDYFSELPPEVKINIMSWLSLTDTISFSSVNLTNLNLVNSRFFIALVLKELNYQFVEDDVLRISVLHLNFLINKLSSVAKSFVILYSTRSQSSYNRHGLFAMPYKRISEDKYNLTLAKLLLTLTDLSKVGSFLFKKDNSIDILKFYHGLLSYLQVQTNKIKIEKNIAFEKYSSIIKSKCFGENTYDSYFYFKRKVEPLMSLLEENGAIFDEKKHNDDVKVAEVRRRPRRV